MAESRGAEVVGRVVRSKADERVAEALAKTPARLLFKMLALAGCDDAGALAMLAADPELELAVEGLQAVG